MFVRPWTRVLLDLIAAGVHDRETLFELATPHVPQGHAYRARELARERQLQRERRVRGADVSQPRHRELKPSAVTIHRVGARLVLRTTLQNLTKTGRLIRDDDHYYLATQTERPVPAVSDETERSA